MSERKSKRVDWYNIGRKTIALNTVGPKSTIYKTDYGIERRKLPAHASVQQVIANRGRENPIGELAEILQNIVMNQSRSDPREKALKELRHKSNFTGSDDISINAFISSMQFHLNKIEDQKLKKLQLQLFTTRRRQRMP